MVLDTLRQLAGRGLVPGLVEEYRPQEQAASLTRLLLDLQHGWEQRIAIKLGSKKLKALRRLMRQSVPDFLHLLGRERDENTNSSVLAWLLDPRQAPTLALPALCALAKFLDDTATWSSRLTEAAASSCLSVKREYTIAREWTAEDSTNRPDLVISGPGFVLCIENKVSAQEHSGQTAGYWRWLSQVTGLRGGLFMSPAGLAPASEGFRAVSYMDLLACLLEGASDHAVDSAEEVVLASYVKTLAGYVLRTELRAVLSGRDAT
jgi:PD-(D/E)XK nuclease superfamily